MIIKVVSNHSKTNSAPETEELDKTLTDVAFKFQNIYLAGFEKIEPLSSEVTIHIYATREGKIEWAFAEDTDDEAKDVIREMLREVKV